ncbi:MAG: haloalkane dehalogenase [Legionellaceae bacterium]|nr:haloalkane dehalogenase [Legionellaceae bacterium]
MQELEIKKMLFPFKSNFINVLQSKIHYIDEGEGDPIVFIHDIPVSNYLWRNVIPFFSDHARCIAPDLIGMGQSGKPKISYKLTDHIKYFNEFMNKLDLENVTLVMHGWGSVIGLNYAVTHADKIKGLIFSEPYLRPVKQFSELSLPMQELAVMIQHPHEAKQCVIDENFFVKRWLQMQTAGHLSAAAMEYYEAPFSNKSDRQLLWQHLQELPCGREHAPAEQVIAQYSSWLSETDIPKLLIYGVPGFNLPMSTVSWAKEQLPNLKLTAIESCLHFPQESNPKAYAKAILKWQEQLDSARAA